MKKTGYIVRHGKEKLENMMFAYDFTFWQDIEKLTRRQAKHDAKYNAEEGKPRIYKIAITLEEIK